MSVVLRGMTWDHSRGYDPMVATAAEYARRHPDVRIEWEKRSLQDFADFPVEQLATDYDLLVIDHPHVGFAAEEKCLVALDEIGRDAELVELARQSLGPSHQSYQYAGHQWALAIDAAAQVASYRADLLPEPPLFWSNVVELARTGRVIWPIKPVDALMSFMTVAANLGTPCQTDGGMPLIARIDGLAVLESLIDLARHVPRECLSMNPVEAYEQMSQGDRFVYCPLGYGYTNYSRDGYRGHLLRFTDIPSLGIAGPRGSTVGGAGIAVSSHCGSIDAAVDYAFWIASADCQKGIYFDSGGQPGNAAAWDDPRCNQIVHGFFSDTRATLDTVYLRPRYHGYLEFQDRAGEIINACLAGNVDASATMDELEQAYEKSLASALRRSA